MRLHSMSISVYDSKRLLGQAMKDTMPDAIKTFITQSHFKIRKSTRDGPDMADMVIVVKQGGADIEMKPERVSADLLKYIKSKNTNTHL